MQLIEIKEAYYKTRNTRIQNIGPQNTGETAENPGTVVEQRNTLKQQRKTSEYEWYTNLTLAEPQWNTLEQLNHKKKKKNLVFFKEI